MYSGEQNPSNFAIASWYRLVQQFAELIERDARPRESRPKIREKSIQPSIQGLLVEAEPPRDVRDAHLLPEPHFQYDSVFDGERRQGIVECLHGSPPICFRAFFQHQEVGTAAAVHFEQGIRTDLDRSKRRPGRKL